MLWGQGPKTGKGAEAPFLFRSFADLFFLDFRQGLAVNAKIRGRAGFEAADADLYATGFAPAVFFVFDQLQRFVDLLDQLALTVTGAQFQAELFFLAGAVRGVGEVCGFVLHVMHGTIHLFHQVLLPFLEDSAEVSAHGIANVLLTLTKFVRFEVTSQLVALLLCFGGHEWTASHSSNPLRRIVPSPTPAGPAAASGRTYQNESERATPGCRGCHHNTPINGNRDVITQEKHFPVSGFDHSL